MKTYNHRLFKIRYGFCKIHSDYWRPSVWGVIGESHHKNYTDKNITSHIRPIESITFRWLFVLVTVKIHHKKDKFETPSDGVITQYK